MVFKHLSLLVPDIDEAFNEFYNALLNELRFADFFKDQQQIESLIEKQKAHFAKMVVSPLEEIEAAYIRLAHEHYDLRIPYVDFMKGLEILEHHFLLHSKNVEAPVELLAEILEFFHLVKSHTAKGYLDRMIEEDKHDIEMFFSHTTVEEGDSLPAAVVMQKIEWLRALLNAIESGKECDPEVCGDYFERWMEDAEFITPEKRKFFEDLEKRIMINTENLFYFLKKGDYLEILPLYTSLLGVYKLTLLLNNSITFEYARHVINDLKIDKLTNLHRKEAFEQFLYKELELGKREKVYHFTVVFIDVDNFKAINDAYGHYNGDLVLQRIGRSIGDNIRACDLGFRIGGDEFALILKNCTKEKSIAVCEKIIAGLGAMPFALNDIERCNIGLSIGLVDNCEHFYSTMVELIKAVDKKLYRAKQEGKNRIVY